MKKSIYIVSLVLFQFQIGYCQKHLSIVDSTNIKMANTIATEILGTHMATSDYIIFIVNQKFVVVQKQRLKFSVFRGEYSFSVESQKNKISNLESEEIMEDHLLDKSFQRKICTPSYQYVGDDPVLVEDSKWGRTYYYFALLKKGCKKCEISLPITGVSNSHKSSQFPIKSKIVKRLVKLMHLFPY